MLKEDTVGRRRGLIFNLLVLPLLVCAALGSAISLAFYQIDGSSKESVSIVTLSVTFDLLTWILVLALQIFAWNSLKKCTAYLNGGKQSCLSRLYLILVFMMLFFLSVQFCLILYANINPKLTIENIARLS